MMKVNHIIWKISIFLQYIQGLFHDKQFFMHASLGSGEPCERPPDALVSTVVWWMQGAPGSPPHLALAPLTHPLPGVSLPMTVVPPIVPLMK